MFCTGCGIGRIRAGSLLTIAGLCIRCFMDFSGLYGVIFVMVVRLSVCWFRSSGDILDIAWSPLREYSRHCSIQGYRCPLSAVCASVASLGYIAVCLVVAEPLASGALLNCWVCSLHFDFDLEGVVLSAVEYLFDFLCHRQLY